MLFWLSWRVLGLVSYYHLFVLLLHTRYPAHVVMIHIMTVS